MSAKPYLPNPESDPHQNRTELSGVAAEHASSAVRRVDSWVTAGKLRSFVGTDEEFVAFGFWMTGLVSAERPQALQEFRYFFSGGAYPEGGLELTQYQLKPQSNPFKVRVSSLTYRIWSQGEKLHAERVRKMSPDIPIPSRSDDNTQLLAAYAEIGHETDEVMESKYGKEIGEEMHMVAACAKLHEGHTVVSYPNVAEHFIRPA